MNYLKEKQQQKKCDFCTKLFLSSQKSVLIWSPTDDDSLVLSEVKKVHEDCSEKAFKHFFGV